MPNVKDAAALERIKRMSHSLDDTIESWFDLETEPGEICAALGYQVARIFRAWTVTAHHFQKDTGQEWHWETEFDEFAAAVKGDLRRSLTQGQH